MGSRGSAPKPTKLRILHGDRKDRINDDEANAPEEPPERPSDMQPDTAEIWDYTVKQLAEMGLLSRADRDTLHTYCAAVATHRKATSSILRDGIMIDGVMGGKVKNPACSVQKEAAGVISSLGRAFGLTPSARSAIRVSAAKPKAPPTDPGRLLTGGSAG